MNKKKAEVAKKSKKASGRMMANKAKKTENVISVSKAGGNKLLLKVADHEVSRNPLRQSIVWELDSALKAGDFVSFEWADPMLNNSTFGAPQISPDGNNLTMTVLNRDEDLTGPRDYILEVNLYGDVYTTRDTTTAKATKALAPRTAKDPIIINK